MNKKSIYLALFSFLFLASLTSCIDDPENEDFLAPNGAVPYVVDIVNGYFDFIDINAATSGFTVKTHPSGSTTVSSITVMKSFNGSEAVEHTTLSGAEGSISVTAADMVAGLGVQVDELELGDVFDITFVLNTGDGRSLKSAISTNIPVSCPSSLGGMYSVTTVYGFHDFLADYPMNTQEVEIKEIRSGIYMVDDFSGGLYAAEGPYGDAYGTTGFPVEFQDICDNISWSGQSDPWGAVNPTDGGTNKVDPATGVITISWTCDAYGENGVSVYTPL